jgi:hypothetical protein
MNHLKLLLLCLVPGVVLAAPIPKHTCRILFLQSPDNAPETLHLFDGATSREVDLPRMNFSKIYELPAGPLTLRMLPAPLLNPEELPGGAPSVKVAEGIVNFYLLVFSDPANTVAPVRMRVISADADRLKPGQMLWFNMTKNSVGGILGSRKLAIGPESRVTIDAPAAGAGDYAVNLSFRIPGKKPLYPLCETRWRHDPRSRSVAFIVTEQGLRTPRVLVFPDYREAKTEKP